PGPPRPPRRAVAVRRPGPVRPRPRLPAGAPRRETVLRPAAVRSTTSAVPAATPNPAPANRRPRDVSPGGRARKTANLVAATPVAKVPPAPRAAARRVRTTRAAEGSHPAVGRGTTSAEARDLCYHLAR
ncbi:hypothetical protein ABT256_34815, partial [Amycolatopsis japonica]